MSGKKDQKGVGGGTGPNRCVKVFPCALREFTGKNIDVSHAPPGEGFRGVR